MSNLLQTLILQTLISSSLIRQEDEEVNKMKTGETKCVLQTNDKACKLPAVSIGSSK